MGLETFNSRLQKTSYSLRLLLTSQLIEIKESNLKKIHLALFFDFCYNPITEISSTSSRNTKCNQFSPSLFRSNLYQSPSLISLTRLKTPLDWSSNIFYLCILPNFSKLEFWSHSVGRNLVINFCPK